MNVAEGVVAEADALCEGGTLRSVSVAVTIDKLANVAHRLLDWG